MYVFTRLHVTYHTCWSCEFYQTWHWPCAAEKKESKTNSNRRANVSYRHQVCITHAHTCHTHTNTNHNTHTSTFSITTIHRRIVTRICVTASKLTSTHAPQLQHSPVRLCKKSSGRTDGICALCIVGGDHSISPPPSPSLSFCFSRTPLYLLHFVDPLLNSSTQVLRR